MFFQLIARSFFNLTLPSCVLSLPTALSCGTSAVTIPKSVPFLRPVGLLSMTGGSRRFHHSRYVSRPCMPPDFHRRSRTNPCRDRRWPFTGIFAPTFGQQRNRLPRWSSPYKLPTEMLASFASALADESSFPVLGTSGPDPFPLLSALTASPPSFLPSRKTVRAAEGHVPTAGVLLHLILPHCLRCPADAYTSHRWPCTILTSIAAPAPGSPMATTKSLFGRSGNPACLWICKAGHIQSLATDSYTGRRTSSLDLAITWIFPHGILCSLLPPSSPTSRHVRSASTMKALSFCSSHHTMIPFTISRTPLGSRPPITLQRSTTFTSPSSTNNTFWRPMKPTSNCSIVQTTQAHATLRLASKTLRWVDTSAWSLCHPQSYRWDRSLLPQRLHVLLYHLQHSQGYRYWRICLPLCYRQDVYFSRRLPGGEARNLVALTRSKGLCLLLFPSTHLHPTGPLHSIRTMCALRHGMFHIGKDRVDLDSFAAFLTQPDTVEFAHDGVTIDTTAPFSLDSWPFTHQISSYGKWVFLPLALQLAFRNARFELTLALRQEVPRQSEYKVTPDLFHWQGHLLDGIRVTLNFGVNCLELASDQFIYVRFPYPAPGLHQPQIEHKGWTLTPDCGSYFFSRASHSLGHIHPSRPGVVDASDPLRPASVLKWPAASPVTRSRFARLPMHDNPHAPPKFLPAASIPFYHMGLEQLCQQGLLQDRELVHAAWLAAFAALTGTTLTHEHMALLQHPLVIAPLRDGDVDKVKDYVTEILSCTGPSWQIKKGRLRSSGSQTPPDDASIQELPRTTQDPLPSWVDKLYARISQLAVLLSEAQDLARSPAGWIKCSALIAYNGPSIPGNFDTHTHTHTHTHTLG